jgi:hypothetical protein
MAKIKAEAEKEAVLLALDQLSQTMDVMRQVVGRLRRNIEQTESQTSQRRLRSKDNANGEEEHETESPAVLH